MNEVVTLSHVTKHFGKKEVLHDISLGIREGEVFGFLGPNGAGKTTTIKLMTGLLSLERGDIFICGHSLDTEFTKAMRHIGAVVENPVFYTYMTGYQNLRLSARMQNGVHKQRIQTVVELVGLSEHIHKKVSHYSLGMKQRLGLAQCLLHDPKVLILDEPTNGLDPEGIRRLRDIIKNLAHHHGRSVLVSSHMMSEMQQMCDRVAILRKGELIGVRSLAELMTASAYRDAVAYQLQVAHMTIVAELIQRKFALVANPAQNDCVEVLVPVANSEAWVWNIIKFLVVSNEPVYSFSMAEQRQLEDAFFELTQEGNPF